MKTTDQPSPQASQPTLESILQKERKAQELRAEGLVQEAFAAYDECARLYAGLGEHFNAAMCYATAATCWDIHTGWQPLHKSASRNRLAAGEALKAGNYEYAAELYRNAALLYEKEGDHDRYSECFMATQRAKRKKQWSLVCGDPGECLTGLKTLPVNWRARFSHFFKACGNILSDLFWGYGERPFRTIGFAAIVIFVSAIFYSYGYLYEGDALVKIDFFDSLYFSVITFTTVGYGHFAPSGWLKAISMLESLAGILITPLFLVALTRRFLRMYR